MKRLLNIDGGGVRVYFPLLILDYIEQKTGKKILDLFDYYSGVSASSIVLSALLTKYTVKDILTIFKDLSKSIFYRSYYYSITSGFGLFSSKYPDTNINSEFQKFFEDINLCDVKKPLSILTYDLANSKPICWHSHLKNHNAMITPKLWEIVRGSTAAPTYFPPYKIDLISHTYLLVDGGVVTNNLSELIFTHALTHFGKDETFFQLSLGTGTYNSQLKYTPSGLLSWGTSIIDVFFKASSSYEMNELKKLSMLENLKYFYRLDINLENDISLDDYNSFDTMDIIFDEWLQKNRDYLDNICNELLKTI